MDPLPLSLLIAAAVLALCALYWVARRNSANVLRGPKLPLLSAAETVYQTARREKLPLLHAIEHSGEEPREWFAASIAGVVPVCKRNGVGFEVCGWGDCEPQSLYIRQKDVRTYLRWARTVQ